MRLLDGWVRALGVLDRLDAWIPRVARDDGWGGASSDQPGRGGEEPPSGSPLRAHGGEK